MKDLTVFYINHNKNKDNKLYCNSQPPTVVNSIVNVRLVSKMQKCVQNFPFGNLTSISKDEYISCRNHRSVATMIFL